MLISFLQKYKIPLLIFLFGLVLRLLVMPFSMHADLLSMYFRAHLVTEFGAWQVASGQFLGHLVYAGNLVVMKLFGWDIAGLFPLPFGLVPGSFTASVGNWLRFQETAGLLQVLFWWKVPHLLADGAVFGLLMSAFLRSKRRNAVLAAWWLNPVNVYAFYIFARHDALTALALMAALLYTARRQLVPAALGLFAAIQIRTQPLLLAPLFLVAWWKGHSGKQLLKQGLVLLVIIAAYLGVQNALPTNEEARNQLTGLEETRVIEKSFQVVSLPGGRFRNEVISSVVGGLPVFPLAYVVLGGAMFFASRIQKKTNSLEYLNAWILLVMAVYFAVNAFSPHYFIWLSLFWVVGFGFQKKLLWPYTGAVVGWLVMGAMATDAFSINQNLFLPLAPGLFRTPQLPALLASRGIDPGVLFLVGRVILSVSLLWLGWRVWRTSLRATMQKIDLKKALTPGIGALIFLLTGMGAPKSVDAIMAPVSEQIFGQQLLYLEPEKPLDVIFTSPVEQFGSLEVWFATDRVASGQQVIFRLKKQDEENWWYEGRLNRDDFYDLAAYPLGFPPIMGDIGQEYVLELELTPAAENHWTAVVGGPEGANVRVVADDTGAFIQQTQNRLRAEYQRSPGFWGVYMLTLGSVLMAFIILVALKNPRR